MASLFVLHFLGQRFRRGITEKNRGRRRSKPSSFCLRGYDSSFGHGLIFWIGPAYLDRGQFLSGFFFVNPVITTYTAY